MMYQNKSPDETQMECWSNKEALKPEGLLQHQLPHDADTGATREPDS